MEKPWQEGCVTLSYREVMSTLCHLTPVASNWFFLSPNPNLSKPGALWCFMAALHMKVSRPLLQDKGGKNDWEMMWGGKTLTVFIPHYLVINHNFILTLCRTDDRTGHRGISGTDITVWRFCPSYDFCISANLYSLFCILFCSFSILNLLRYSTITKLQNNYFTTSI